MGNKVYFNDLLAILKAFKEPVSVVNSSDGETSTIEFRGFIFVFDSNGDPIMAKRVIDGVDEVKSIVIERLEKASNNHRGLCGRFPSKGDMVDRASYVALGRVSALEDLLKCLK